MTDITAHGDHAYVYKCAGVSREARQFIKVVFCTTSHVRICICAVSHVRICICAASHVRICICAASHVHYV